jgi:superfamily I DNA/RNA helicase
VEAINRAKEQSILLAAFNKRAATELAVRLANPCAEALTLHSIGFRAVRRYWEKIGVDSGGKRALALAEAVCGEQAPDAIKRLVSKLCTKAREITPFVTTPEALIPLALQFDCVPDDAWAKDGYDLDYVCAKTLDAVVLAAKVKPTATGIDFADMIFLPLRNQWLRPTYGLVVVDEAQDMTEAQLALARGVCGGRFCIVGDDRQAIYAFRGADSGSLDRLKAELSAQELGLTITYRCGQSIVARAQRLVPDYEAAASNPEGIITTEKIATLFENVAPGDFVLSRKNAPLVSVALGLIRRGKRAKIEGRDIGAGLKAIVNKLAKGPASSSVPKFLERLDAWREKEITRAEKLKSDAKVEQVADQFETLVALTDGVAGIPELLLRLENLFADDAQAGPSQVVCSSVHRAKGLETDTVWILSETLYPPVACEKCRKRPKGCTCPDGYVPDPLASREEQNIEYVAVTRAKTTLCLVEGKVK